jgi:hypothetical protein
MTTSEAVARSHEPPLRRADALTLKGNSNRLGNTEIDTLPSQRNRAQ